MGARWLLLIFGCLSVTGPLPGDDAPPVKLTAQEDHERLRGLLKISEIRRGADGRKDSANPPNYDESKVAPLANFPDPLVCNNGDKVTKPTDWWDRRRGEIVELFDREVYGRVPATTPRVNWEVVSTVKEVKEEIPVVVKTLAGHVDNSAYPAIKVDIELTLTTPEQAAGPVPVIIEFGFRFPRPAGAAAPPPRPPAAGPSWQKQVLSKGWGYAILYPNSVQADNGAGLTAGIIGLCNKGQPRGVEDWGALRAWAWGASRAIDYFETDPAVDAKRVGIEGMSRYGKAALVSMAYEPRLAIAYVASSGAGGAKLHRRNFGELVENVAAPNEYHWMAGNYLKYASTHTADDLPVDSHELVALCAPRPVFIGGGTTTAGDGWVDSKGMFLAAAYASPVYELLGRKGVGTTEFPPLETPLIAGDVGFRQHAAGHTPGPNWPTFIEFASRYLAAGQQGASPR